MTFVQRRSNGDTTSLTFVQIINVDTTSFLVFNVVLTSLYRHEFIQRRINVDVTS